MRELNTKDKIMSNEEKYEVGVEYQEYMRLINEVEILTQAEKEFCEKWDKEECKQVLNYIEKGRWLNINVYSEHDHEKKQFEYETGQ